MNMDISNIIKTGFKSATQALRGKSKPLIQRAKQNTGDAVTHLKQNATHIAAQSHNALTKTSDILQDIGQSLLRKNSAILNNAASFIPKGDNKIQQADYQKKLEKWADGFSGRLIQKGIPENNAEEIKNGFLKMTPEQLNFSYAIYQHTQGTSKKTKNNISAFTSEGLGDFEKQVQNDYQFTLQRLSQPQSEQSRAKDLMFFFHHQDMLNIIKNEKTNRSQNTEVPKTENKDNQIIQSGLEKLLNIPDIEKNLDKGKLQDFLQSNRELTPEILNTMLIKDKKFLLLKIHPDKIDEANKGRSENQKFTEDEMTLITKMINNIEN